MSNGQVHRKEPTYKMLEFAHKLAETLSIPVPAEIETDFDACADWLDEAAAKVPSTPKQRALAERIAAAKGISVPSMTLNARFLLSKWIEKNNNPD